jgi:hypothetical protein
MEGISENVSKNRADQITPRRGRPRIHTSEAMAVYRGLWPEHNTRALQNKRYQSRAQAVLQDELGIEWLMDLQKLNQGQKCNYRQTMLQELGRIDNDEHLKAIARQLCEIKPTSIQAIAMIRRWRLGHDAPTSTEGLADYLRHRLNQYLQTHHDCTLAQAREAVQQLMRDIEASE